MRLPTPPVDLCKSVQSVGELFWLRGVYHPTEQTGRGCSPTDFTDSHRWCVFGILRSVGIQFSHGLHRSTQMVGCVSGCLGTAGCHTLLYLCKSVLSVGDPSLQEASVRSVRSVGVPLLAWLVQQRLLHPLRLHQCHLWKALLSKKFLCVLWVLWEAIP